MTRTQLTRTLQRVAACGAAAVAVACGDSSTAPSSSSPSSPSALSDAFLTIPFGWGATYSSFAAADSDWTPGDSVGGVPGDGFGGHHGGHHHGGDRGDGLGGRGLMGGGLGADFFGGIGGGHGFGHGPFGEGGDLPVACTFSSDTGRVTCDPVTFNGITVVRSAAYADADGNAQAAPDSTTNTINLRSEVSGTVVRRDGDTVTVQHASDRTVAGLAPGSTERRVDGASAGHETIVGSSSEGHFTAERTIGDTTSGVVVPVQDSVPTYPTAGTLVRAMQVTVTFDGQSPQSAARREVVTYDGSSTATVVITQNDSTRTCTMALPRGRLTCQ